ncbi:MAG: PAS domain S-box protein [Dehalococcoidia bacterium]|nr:PAS domain S-box protein [Dehalococcoidia bacterium]
MGNPFVPIAPGEPLPDAAARALLDAAPVLIWVVAEEGGCTYCNVRWLEFRGRELREELGEGWMEGVHPDDLDRCIEVYQSHLSTRQPFEMPYRILRHDGEYRWMMVRGAPLTGPDGAFAGFAGSCTDITAEVEAEDRSLRSAWQLRDRVTELETLLEVLPVGIGLAVDRSARDIRVNRAFANMLAISPTENASKSSDEGAELPFRVLREGIEVPAQDLPIQRAVRGETVVDEEYDLLLSDGRLLHLLEYAAPLLDPGGKPRGAVGAFLDITARKRAEDQLREANAAKDEFLASVSHELRTPLTLVVGLVSYLHRRRGELSAEDQSDALDQLTEAVSRLESLIENMLLLSQLDSGPEFELEPVLLPRVVQGTVAAHKRRHPSRTIELNLERGLPVLLARPTWLDQVLTNLLSNAEKYSPKDATITIEARSMAGRVEIAVLDRGPGLPTEQADRVFRAFERLERDRSRAPGLGLGLTVSKRLVELMDGTIGAAPRPEGGTRFIFTIPAIADEGE